MKKLYAIMLSSFLLLSLTACGEIGGDGTELNSDISSSISSSSQPDIVSDSNSIDTKPDPVPTPSPELNSPTIKNNILINKDLVPDTNIKNLSLFEKKNISEFISDNKNLFESFNTDVGVFKESIAQYEYKKDNSKVIISSQYGVTNINIKIHRYQTNNKDKILNSYISKFVESFNNASVKQPFKYAYPVSSGINAMDDFSYKTILQYDNVNKKSLTPYSNIKNYSVSDFQDSFFFTVTISYEENENSTVEDIEKGKEGFLQACKYYGFPTEGYTFTNNIETATESGVEE